MELKRIISCPKWINGGNQAIKISKIWKIIVIEILKIRALSSKSNEYHEKHYTYKGLHEFPLNG